MPTIERLTALEILDSRGRPTVQCTCRLASGAAGTASVPSGASTGSAEALELRDGDPDRYRGLGCRKAVGHINGEIQQAFRRRAFVDQAALDQALIDLDGTPNKARLGANALLAVSLAFARAAAHERAEPLYVWFARMIDQTPAALPLPLINLFSGGKHAGGQIEVQDVQIVALTARSIDEALSTTFAVFYAAADWIAREYAMRMLTADEGGLAPAFPNVPAMYEASVRAIEAAQRHPGREVALAVDVAASHFHSAQGYALNGRHLSSADMVAHLLDWLRDYPIISIEDGLAEDDWAGWTAFRQQAPASVMILGDDLLCTNPARIQQAVDHNAANALLLKVNQIGTLTQAAEAYRLARANGWRVVVSARSGETEDNWLADLAVGWSADHIKVGAITQSERLAKYNRLLEIEQETGFPLVHLR